MKKVIKNYEFIACDGSQFDTEDKCRNWEQHLRDMEKAKVILKDNPCVGEYICDILKKEIKEAEDLNWKSTSFHGYDRVVDDDMKKRAYDKLSDAVYEFMKKLHN